MAIRDWPVAERPREKLLQQGAECLTDAELLAIFLRTGVKGRSAVQLAQDLVEAFGGIRALLSSNLEQFSSHLGLGPAKYAQMQAVLELARRHCQETLKREQVFTSSTVVKQYLSHQLSHQRREIFACLFLDNHHRLLAYDELFSGTLTSAEVHPREVVRQALHHNAAAVILAHNHPSSGSVLPSPCDRELTERLIEALELIDVRVLDHMIVGDGAVGSFSEMGLI